MPSLPAISDRRKKTDRKYQIKELWHLHHEILRRTLLGQKGSEIAKELGCSVPVVSYTKNSAMGKRHLELMRGAADAEAVDVSERIKDMGAKAVALMEGLLNEAIDEAGVSFKDRMALAGEILDRAGFAAPKVIRTENFHAHFDGNDLEAIKQRARESGAVIDVDAEVVEEEV